MEIQEWNNDEANGGAAVVAAVVAANNEECDHFSFDDSDRFEEDSICTWSSEPESMCNNWRGWKKPTNGATTTNGGPGNSSSFLGMSIGGSGGGGGSSGGAVANTSSSSGNGQGSGSDGRSSNERKGCPVTTLTELAARCVATYIPFELVEHVFPPVPEQLQLRIAFWSFPDNEDDIRLYSCLANSSAEEFHRGETLFKSRSVKDPLQIGFHLSASVAVTQPRAQFNVAVTFDRRKIATCNCTCTSVAYWCSHVVAVCLHRIHCPNEVCLRAPVSESLTRLQRDQLQKFAQYLISELPQQILPTAQRLLDELLSAQPTAINTVCGAPDPTAGASANDQTNWYLDEKTLHENIKKILIKFCLPAPMVYSDVNYLTNCAPPAAAEWSSLLRPLRGREPEGMWNLLSIVREMYRRCDRNAIRLLEIITEECMATDQILVWWFNTKLSMLAVTGSHSGGKHNNTHSNSNASQHACSSLCDEIVVLWRLAALNPGLAPDERDMLHAQFTAWHLKILDRVAKNRVGISSHSSKQQQNIRSDAELFTGFKSAIEACYLDWEDYPILGVTHTQDTNPMYHCPFTCFKQHTETVTKGSGGGCGGGVGDSGCSAATVNGGMSLSGGPRAVVNQVNSSQTAVLMNSGSHFNPNHLAQAAAGLAGTGVGVSSSVPAAAQHQQPQHQQNQQQHSQSAGTSSSTKATSTTASNATSGTLVPRRPTNYNDRFYVSYGGGGAGGSGQSNSNDVVDALRRGAGGDGSGPGGVSIGGGRVEGDRNVSRVVDGGRRMARDDGNRSTASSEGFCENEDEPPGGSESVVAMLPPGVMTMNPLSSSSSSSTSLNEGVLLKNLVGAAGSGGAHNVSEEDDDEDEQQEQRQPQRRIDLVVSSATQEQRRSESLSSSESLDDNMDYYEFKERQERTKSDEARRLDESVTGGGEGSSSVVNVSETSADVSGITLLDKSLDNVDGRTTGKTGTAATQSSNVQQQGAQDGKGNQPQPQLHRTQHHIQHAQNKSQTGNQIFSNLKPTEDAWDILFARAEGLHAHGHGREACTLAVRLAEELLSNPPNLIFELPPPPKRKGKKQNVNPISHQMSVLASGTLSKCAFLCTVLAESSEHSHLAFCICLYGLEMARPPASTKPLEVKLANQEADLLCLLKRIPLGQMELRVIREKAEQLRDCTFKSRGEALLPIMLASFIFDALAQAIGKEVAGQSQTLGGGVASKVKMVYRYPTDENLGFEAAVAAMGLKANVSEAEHPLLCEGTRRQRGELASTLLYNYKDDPRKVARIMDKLLDRDIHVLLKGPLLPAYYSNNPPVRSALQQSRREEQEAAAHLLNDQLQAEYSSNSRPQSSTSAELEMGMGAMSLSAAANAAAAAAAAGGHQNAASPNLMSQSTPTSAAAGSSGGGGNPMSSSSSTSTGTRPKDLRYKGKRAYPSIPNQPSEASAHFMFELAKTVLTKAGGTSSTSLFTQATTSQNHHLPHRALHMCAFQLGLYALGLHNCVSPNWLSRTYSSHVCWIIGQAMEIGAPAISFLIDTWEGHLTPPEAASMADRASRGWDNNMIYPAAELALSVLPHAAALNPSEIQRAILQCKEQSDKMLERACIIVENAAKSGGVYPEVLFQVARYWNELYLRNTPGGGEPDHDVNMDVHLDHNVNFGQFDVNMSMEQQQQQQQPQQMMPGGGGGIGGPVGGGQPGQGPPQGPGMVVQGPPQMMGGPPQVPPNGPMQGPPVVHGAGPGQQVMVSGAPGVNPGGPPGPPQGPYHQGAMGISPPYGYSFPCQNLYTHHHGVPFPHGQMHHPMYIAPQPPPQFPGYPGAPNNPHAAAVAAAVAQQQQVQQQQQQQQQQQPHPFVSGVPPAFHPGPHVPPMPGQGYPGMPGGGGVGKPYGAMGQGPPNVMGGGGGQGGPMQYYGNPQGMSGGVGGPPPPQQGGVGGHHNVVYPFVAAGQAPPAPAVRQRHPHQYSPTQLRYLMAAYNVGMLAMETLARRVHDDRPQAKYARDPPYGEDVKWLLRVSKKLGTQYLHQYSMCAVNSIVSPFVLHDVAIEAAHYLARNNPTMVLQHLRSALAPLVTKCQQMYIQCIHQKLYHLTTADYEDFANIILAARTAFQISVDGNAQFKDWLQSIKRSKSCKKDLWAQINATLNNSK